MTSIHPEKNPVTANSVLEKIKSLSITNSKNITEGNKPVSFASTSQAYSPTPSNENNTSGLWNIIRYILILLLICYIILNILALLNLLPPNLAEFFNPFLLFLGHTQKPASSVQSKPVTTLNNSTDISYNSSQLNAIENSVKIPDDPLLTSAKTPNYTNSVPLKKLTAGYCYVGEEQGFRSCVKVDEADTCLSGDIFPTKAVCINPKLRP